MAGQSRPRHKKQHFTPRQYMHMEALLFVVVVLAIGVGVYHYSFNLFPRQLQSGTSLTSSAAHIPQSVAVRLSGQYAVVRVYSGPGEAAQPLTIEGAPTMSRRKVDGRSIIKMKIIGSSSDAAVSPNSDIDYTVSLLHKLRPGQYEVKITMDDRSIRVLSSDFRVS